MPKLADDLGEFGDVTALSHDHVVIVLDADRSVSVWSDWGDTYAVQWNDAWYLTRHEPRYVHGRSGVIAEVRALIALDGACAYTFDGYDTDGTPWYLCETHDITAPSPDGACAGNNNSPALVRD